MPFELPPQFVSPCPYPFKWPGHELGASALGIRDDGVGWAGLGVDLSTLPAVPEGCGRLEACRTLTGVPLFDLQGQYA